jgi:hypothetical protein
LRARKAKKIRTNPKPRVVFKEWGYNVRNNREMLETLLSFYLRDRDKLVFPTAFDGKSRSKVWGLFSRDRRFCVRVTAPTGTGSVEGWKIPKERGSSRFF